jgi:pimeloyl-ACP methyl ester carboxylesterase
MAFTQRSNSMATQGYLSRLKPARFALLTQAALRHGASWLSRWAPGLAERAGVLLFITPPRRFPRALPDVEGLTPLRTTLRSGRYRIGAWEWGQGPAVLLIHGWGGQASQWVPFVRPLVAAGHRVIAPDLPAHGFSSGWRTTLPDFVQAVGTVGWHAGRIQGIVAHSLGATATALALAHGLHTQRVVLIAPPADVPYFVRRLAAWMHLPAPRVEGLLHRVARRAGMELDALELRRVAPTLGTPALVVHSRKDREVPFAHGEAVAGAWPGAILLPLEGSGHTRVLEDPAVIAAAVAFVRAASAPVLEPAEEDDGDRVPYRAAL